MRVTQEHLYSGSGVLMCLLYGARFLSIVDLITCHILIVPLVLAHLAQSCHLESVHRKCHIGGWFDTALDVMLGNDRG